MNSPIRANSDSSRMSIDVLDSTISYIESGSGTPVIFLHGNPTYSYLWRNIIPIVDKIARCIAPDLIGMGFSGSSTAERHGFHHHFKYIDAWLQKMNLNEPLIFVLHDWGSAIGFHWAFKNPDKVKALVYMEAIVQPRLWSDFPEGRDQIFRALRSDKGEPLVYEENFFVETVLPKSIIRTLTEEEMNTYRHPFIEKSKRKTTLDLARDLPIDGTPADVAALVNDYGLWLADCDIPKLLIVAEPGALLHGRNLEFARTWKNQREVHVKGIHYPQEDMPAEIGHAIRDFVAVIGKS